jgi:membrane protein implicated in regulation of membrane protease activity
MQPNAIMNHWWMWIVLGAVFTGIELLTPGLFIIFFAVAATIVGLLVLLGVVSTPWVQWLLFSVLALVALRFFRRPLLSRIQKDTGPDLIDSLIGEMAIAVTTMAPGEHGRVELRGSMWNSHNIGTGTIEAASRCRVVAVEGLRLDVANDLM